MINAILEVFQAKLHPADQDLIKSCRPPRNKAVHGSYAELMIVLNGVAPGREIDTRARKRKPLREDEIIEGTLCIDQNHGLEDFSKRAKEAAQLLERKILRTLKPKT